MTKNRLLMIVIALVIGSLAWELAGAYRPDRNLFSVGRRFDYHVSFFDHQSGYLDVVLEIPETTDRGFVELPLHLLGGDTGDIVERIRRLRITLDGRGVRTLNSPLSDRIYIYLYQRGISLRMEYSINPNTEQAKGVPASRLDPDYAFLQMKGLLMIPDRFAPMGVRFRLPPGWQSVLPWPEENERFVFDAHDQRDQTIFGSFGPFDIEQIEHVDAEFRLAFWRDMAEQEEYRTAIVQLKQSLMEQFPDGLEAERYSLAVVPVETAAEVFAGQNSLISEADISALAMDMARWWIVPGHWVSRPELDWLSQGLAEFFGSRALVQTGLWSQTDQAAYERKQEREAEATQAELDEPINLEQALALYQETGEKRYYRYIRSRAGAYARYLQEQLEQAPAAEKDLADLVTLIRADEEAELDTLDALLARVEAEYDLELEANLTHF